MSLLSAQVSDLSRVVQCIPRFAHIKTSNEGQAIEREKFIIKLLDDHGPKDVYWLADKMGWTAWGMRRRLTLMLKQQKITYIRSRPRKFAALNWKKASE